MSLALNYQYLDFSGKYLGKINYILASKIVQHFFNVSEEALSVFIGAKFNPFIF
jgi:dsRNA-specific ribonuclease